MRTRSEQLPGTIIATLRTLFLLAALTLPLALLATSATAHAQTTAGGAAVQTEPHRGGEANLVLPGLSRLQASLHGGISAAKQGPSGPKNAPRINE